MFHGHHFQQIQKYPFVYGDCLFDSLAFLFHYSQNSLQLQIQCMTHFAQSLQQPINPQIQELIDIQFNVFSLYEDHGINSLQTYIQKISTSANSRGLWGDNCAVFCLANYLHRPIHVWSKNSCVICFRTSDDFISNSTLQLFYQDDMVIVRNGHYEPITFYNASWEVDQNIPTNQQQCPLNNKVKNDLYLCMELMIICTHKNKNLKYHMKMWLKNLNISIGNPCTMNN